MIGNINCTGRALVSFFFFLARIGLTAFGLFFLNHSSFFYFSFELDSFSVLNFSSGGFFFSLDCLFNKEFLLFLPTMRLHGSRRGCSLISIITARRTVRHIVIVTYSRAIKHQEKKRF